MAVLRAIEGDRGSAGDLVVAWLDGVLAELGATVSDADEVSDAVRIDRIARLEQLRSVTAAAQAAECVRFARSQVGEQMAAGVHPRQIGRGIADQIGLACRASPVAASRRLGSARALWFDLPETLRLLTTGSISERVAEAVITETRHLDAPARRDVDAQIAAAGIADMGLAAATACARRHAYEADRAGFVQRGRTERKHRRVGLRPKPDTMALLTGYLPVEQGVACLAALRSAADATVATGSDQRSRDQIMADTLVERITGQAAAGDVNVELQITMPIDALLDPNNARTATIGGAGPVPADIARDILSTTRGRRWWRRLFTGPRAASDPDVPAGAGPIVGGDPFRRRFDGWLAQLLRARDQTCRDPYCDAPIRHFDHISRHADGGETTYPNGRGVCVRGNLVREMPGWQVTLLDGGFHGRPHAVRVTTPTGHRYHSRAPDPP